MTAAVTAPAATEGANRLSVLHIVTTTAFAGIEQHVVRLAGELQALGCTSLLACPPTAARMRAEAAAVDVEVIPRESAGGAWVAHLLRRASAVSPDIVHVHDGVSAAVGALVAPLAAARMVRTQHFAKPASSRRGGWRGGLSVEFHRRLNRRLDGFIAVSQAAAAGAEQRREAVGANTAIIPPGIALPDDEAVAAARSARSELRHPVASFMGRLEPERQVDVLLNAIPSVLDRVPDCRFAIAGSGALEGDLKTQARRLGVNHAVEWKGWVGAPQALLAGSHVYVNPLPWEGFGMATAEAMAYALPVVAIDSGASAEIVTHEESGLLVPADDPEALASAVIRLVADRSLAGRLGDEARRRAVEHYGVARTAQATLDFYARVKRAGAR